MSDSDQTVYSGQSASDAPQTPKSKRNLWLIIGGIGCVLILCIVLLLMVGFILFRKQSVWENILTGLGSATPSFTLETPTGIAATPTFTLEVTIEATTTLVTQNTPTIEPTTQSMVTVEPTQEVAGEPKFSSITFALSATDQYKPIDPGVTFQEGITEVHAIFEYSGMSKDYTWERVWYLEDKEILRNSQKWAGDAAGVFDYFIDAGDEPLFPGKWKLELYVNKQLLTSGNFTVEPKAGPELAQTGEPTTESKPTPATAKATPVPSPTRGSSGGGLYQLAYTKWDGGQHNIYIADTNGSNERLIITRGAGPSWTPDGKYIFFYGEQGIDRQIRDGIEYINTNYSVSNGIIRVVMSPFPTDVSQLDFFQGPGWNDGTARWANVAPNGQMVAFDAKPGGGDYRIFFLGTADNQQYRFEILGEQADWSPDSQKIVYRSGRNGQTGLWISNRDDSGHTNITQGGSDSFPAWSPDGKTIAFSRDENSNVDIYLANVDGSNIRRITDTPGPDTLPIYTPSGDIVFRSARAGSWGVWKMSGNGTNQKEIIPNAGVGPDWSFSKMDVK